MDAACTQHTYTHTHTHIPHTTHTHYTHTTHTTHAHHTHQFLVGTSQLLSAQPKQTYQHQAQGELEIPPVFMCIHEKIRIEGERKEGRGGKEGRRKGERKEGRDGGKEKGKKGGTEEKRKERREERKGGTEERRKRGRKGGREEGRKGGREESCHSCVCTGVRILECHTSQQCNTECQYRPQNSHKKPQK